MSLTPIVADEFPTVSETDWRALVARSLRGAGVKALSTRSDDGIAVGPIYAQDGPGRVVAGKGRWDVVQRIDLPEAASAERQIAEDLANGADGVALIFAGSPAARGTGLLRRDAVRLVDGIPRGRGVRIDGGDASLAIARDLMPLARAREFDLTVSFDPLATLAARGGLATTYEELVDGAVAVAHKLDGGGIAGSAIIADGRPWNDGGASEVQELAAVVAAYVAFLRVFEGGGYPPSRAIERIGVTLAADVDEFLTIAKFRAVRLLIGRVLDAVGQGGRAFALHAETAWRMMTLRDPHTNILRTSIAAFAAGVGGADSMTVLPFDAVPGPAQAFGRRLARNTQLILTDEANIHRVADPGAGAGAIETVTEALAAAAWEKFRAIEAAGGLLAAIRSGAVQRDIAAMRDARLDQVARRERVLTGTSAYPDLAAAAPRTAPPPAEDDSSGGRIEALKVVRLSEPFERLRARADALARAGTRPTVRVVRIGKAGETGAVAAEMVNILAAGGIAAEADGPAVVACICASPEASAGEIEASATQLKAAGTRCVLLAGRASAGIGSVDASLAEGANIVETLARTLDQFENVASVQ